MMVFTARKILAANRTPASRSLRITTTRAAASMSISGASDDSLNLNLHLPNPPRSIVHPFAISNADMEPPPFEYGNCSVSRLSFGLPKINREMPPAPAVTTLAYQTLKLDISSAPGEVTGGKQSFVSRAAPGPLLQYMTGDCDVGFSISQLNFISTSQDAMNSKNCLTISMETTELPKKNKARAVAGVQVVR